MKKKKKTLKEKHMENWKTTSGGLVGGLASLLGGLKMLLAHNYEMAMTMITGGIAMIWTGFHATDVKK